MKNLVKYIVVANVLIKTQEGRVREIPPDL